MRTWDELELPYEDVQLAPQDVAELSWLRRGIAQVVWGRDAATIKTGPYAGRLIIPDRCVLDIEELVPGTVEALLPLAHTGIRRAEEPSHVGAARVSAWEYLLGVYGEMLYTYVAQGIRRQYAPRRLETSLPRGRVDLARTVTKHRARGHPEVLSCVIRELTDDSPFHRLLVSAAVRADRVLALRGQSPSLRQLRHAVVSMSGIPIERSPDFGLARHELGPHPAENLTVLADLAEAILQGISAVPTSDVFREQPASVWINVESIFEQAMRNTVAELTAHPVRAGKGDGTRLLQNGEAMDADPDIVIRAPGDLVIADAKYRRHGSDVGRDELYQLISHATAYGARHAALITPRMSETDTNRFLGYDKYGCAYEVLVVDADSADRVRTQLGAWLQRRFGDDGATLASAPSATLLPSQL